MGSVLSISGQLNGNANTTRTRGILLKSVPSAVCRVASWVSTSCEVWYIYALAQDETASFKLDNAGVYTVAYSDWLTEDNNR